MIVFNNPLVIVFRNPLNFSKSNFPLHRVDLVGEPPNLRLQRLRASGPPDVVMLAFFELAQRYSTTVIPVRNFPVPVFPKVSYGSNGEKDNESNVTRKANAKFD